MPIYPAKRGISLILRRCGVPQVRLTPQNFEGSCKWDFAKLNLYLSIFEQPSNNTF